MNGSMYEYAVESARKEWKRNNRSLFKSNERRERRLLISIYDIIVSEMRIYKVCSIYNKDIHKNAERISHAAQECKKAIENGAEPKVDPTILDYLGCLKEYFEFVEEGGCWYR